MMQYDGIPPMAVALQQLPAICVYLSLTKQPIGSTLEVWVTVLVPTGSK